MRATNRYAVERDVAISEPQCWVTVAHCDMQADAALIARLLTGERQDDHRVVDRRTGKVISHCKLAPPVA